jgi:hypothetical protein
MTSWDSAIIQIDCSCGHRAKLNRDDQIKKFGTHVKIVDLNYFYEQFICEKCGAKRPKTFDKNNNLLFDPKNLKKCVVCKRYVSIPRLKNLDPADNYCSPECQSIQFSPEEQKKMNERIEIVDKKKEKEVEEKKKTIILLNKFQEKKYVMLETLKLFKQGMIKKDEYEKKFKQVSWWIKEKHEKRGGFLVDNPVNYISCPKCKHLTLILWTPKHNRYFLGCSEYRNGCNWAKTIWAN